jgi:hypothetical protein
MAVTVTVSALVKWSRFVVISLAIDLAGAMDRRLSQRRRTLAPAKGARLSRLSESAGLRVKLDNTSSAAQPKLLRASR